MRIASALHLCVRVCVRMFLARLGKFAILIELDERYADYYH